MRVLVEACVTSLEEAQACAAAGADRLELCHDLSVDGVTPPRDLIEEVTRSVTIPTFVMIRARPGDFVYAPSEVDAMVRSLRDARDAGAAGFVFGALAPDDRVDTTALAAIRAAAGEAPLTFHRAFDYVADRIEALEALEAHGVARVLTGGGPGKAIDQVEHLSSLVRASRGVTVLAAGGIRGDHVESLVAATGVSEVHARAVGVPGIVEALDPRP